MQQQQNMQNMQTCRTSDILQPLSNRVRCSATVTVEAQLQVLNFGSFHEPVDQHCSCHRCHTCHTTIVASLSTDIAPFSDLVYTDCSRWHHVQATNAASSHLKTLLTTLLLPAAVSARLGCCLPQDWYRHHPTATTAGTIFNGTRQKPVRAFCDK